VTIHSFILKYAGVDVGPALTFQHDPVEPVSDLAKDFQPVFSIVIGPIDGLAPVSS